MVAAAQGKEQFVEKVVIIGSGPAGLTAAVYCARANLNPVVFEGVMAGGSAGGQLTTTTEVENFPGFPDGITGPELVERMKQQAVKYGARMVPEDVLAIDCAHAPLMVKGDTEVQAHAVIIATGAVAKRMHVPAEERLWNRGISACAVCDGALPIFRNKELLVVGGGDSAVEEASYLTNFASMVYIVHRRDALRASQIMVKRAMEHPKITLLWNTVLVDALGTQKVEGAVLKDVVSGATREIPVNGIFYAIGHTPNTAFIEGQIKLNETGYIVTVPSSTVTSAEGVFACGDVQDSRYRQAITAAGSGCMAALDAQRYLESHEG
ncbi:MAG: thioredoxin-disulfide reductase [Candidatus Raymondbacteria bacterium RifOxyA12_full_50_37]|uniref:Thioredoxin reductase n=1 Tax=Candidatus Raymondbacteria bacterium RIFOXYD12_FULL_49_13 TaxID=1817890 RepID=A0A1F7F8T0_UNCRA|nr:MAG: thioredoxin-disulfide reductase [Candidatus Raymondbacteria bacterium RifOxyA12_full_50_37]OGJ85430.1 MAG: thioredoxin-disulfide reductase [Candidatus Raymondbacteria bacterium RIFOXYA2_FULL_49_16]OGJ91050.1 MAG: thioredoxin-disulfide reductase [Candidatus Raymondbacteria bacterium RifOxyB12_full_50_8]OGJ94938.1 MAG: thioredoxin-disulfide reductase [Candidatus Raymondbacteria bacterium RIFOXYC2_FULL_50_21]OGK03055.1 MAG: thioredoxin-disulfide reductase [Candidatus Raymondbacteria bacter